MQKFLLSAAAALTLLSGKAIAEETPVIGIVNFAACVTESKSGKKEQANMESMRQQMTTLVEDTEKELREIAGKFEDPDYLDSLSPKAEEELKTRFQTLQEDLGRYQNQFYQVLNHANYQMVQKLQGNTAKAAEIIAQQKKLDYVMNKEACFYIRPDLDVTDSVISIMDKNFELEEKSSSVTSTSEDLKLNNAESEKQAR